jgi:DNA (cytosine-5)-methyltransferase 1
VTRPRLLDLFCGAGGAAVGYHRAGFDVVGVDNKPQPNYPFEFYQADALEALENLSPGVAPIFIAGFDAIHASPPCHDHSPATGRNRKAQGPHGTGWMLHETISRLLHVPVPWVVENVEGARMPRRVYNFRLCGSSFGLDLRRHRKWASNLLMLAPPCAHYWQQPRFPALDGNRHRTEGYEPVGSRSYLARVVGVHGHLNYAGEREVRERAMGIDWMTPDELTQAIPPAYTRWIGAQLIAHLEAAA